MVSQVLRLKKLYLLLRAVSFASSFRRGAVQVSRHVVVPEREINWPGVGAFELVAVIYHSGNTPISGHFWCVSRATDGRWYTFDDREVLQFSAEPEQKFTRNVHLMVYTPCGGRADFAGMVGGTCQPAGEAAPAPASDSMHPGIAVEQGTGAASVPLIRAARGGPRGAGRPGRAAGRGPFS